MWLLMKNVTPLIHAADMGHNICVNLLLKAGADMNRINKDGQTCLMAAAVNGYDKVVAALIKAGADVNQKDNKQNTALMLAANGVYVGELIEDDETHQA